MRTIAIGSIALIMMMLPSIGLADQGGKHAPGERGTVTKTVSARTHRYVTGKLIDISAGKNAIRLWVSGGEQTFSLERSNSILPLLKTGAPVTVELNEAGNVISVRRNAQVRVPERDQGAPVPSTRKDRMTNDPGLIF